MERVRLFAKPQLRTPTLIAAFGGWNDAAQAATASVRFLARRWLARRLGEIDPEEFFDFTEARPTVRIVDGALRKIEWPLTEVFYCDECGQSRDYLLLVGIEPQLRWRTFVETILAICHDFEVDTLITVGALLADVPHTVPTKVVGFSNDSSLGKRLRRLNALPSQYEGPTGILGVLNAAADERGLHTASLWGSVPMYISAIPNPKVNLGLLQRLDGLLDLGLNLRDLEETSRQFDQQVAEAIAGNPQIAAYVRQLEDRESGLDAESRTGQAAPATMPDLPSGKSLVDDIEEFLRRQQLGDGE